MSRDKSTPMWAKDHDEVARQVRRIQKATAAGSPTKHALAILASVRPSTLTGLERPDWNPMASTLSALVRALNSYEGKNSKSKCDA